jgi:hypothetical protein
VILIIVLPDKSNNVSKENESFVFTKHGSASIINTSGTILSDFDIEIADTPEKLKTGLMYRDKLQPNQGMLFIFPEQEIRSFWMKNTYLPLDILFINSDSVIVSISQNTTPFSENSINSKAPSQYVLELNAGIVKKYDISLGDKFTWTKD